MQMLKSPAAIRGRCLGKLCRNMKKRLSKKLHKKFIDDIVYEISVSHHWRKEIFSLETGQFLLINKDSVIPLPAQILPLIKRYNLQYAVCIAEVCLEQFDEGLVVFEFSSRVNPKLKRYSGNNPIVV